MPKGGKKSKKQEPIEDEEIPSDFELEGEEDQDEDIIGDRDEENEDDDDDIDESEDEEFDDVDDETHGKMLLDVLDELDKSDNPAKADAKKKRRLPQESEAHEMIAENEFSKAPEQGGISISSLVGALGDSTHFGDLKKRLEQMEKQAHKRKKTQEFQSGGGALNVPAPEVVANRIERSQAYKDTSEDLGKWDHIVKHNREAEQLIFPLQAPPAPKISTASMVTNFKPQTDLELDIIGVLKESGIDESKIKQFQLQMNRITEDQIQARMDQLAKMRQLLFYQERKNKKRNKIKSKDYHRRMKKAKEKKALKEEEKALLDPELARTLTEQSEAKRVKERMTLKHKYNSKFAKDAKRAAHYDEGTRQAVEEHLKLGRELSKKMATAESSDEEDNQQDELQHEDEDETAADHQEDEDGEQQENSGIQFPKKGLFSLQFMQRGILARLDSNKDDTPDYEDEDKRFHTPVVHQGDGTSKSAKKVSFAAAKQTVVREDDQEVSIMNNTSQIQKVGVSGGVKTKSTAMTVEVPKIFEPEEFPDVEVQEADDSTANIWTKPQEAPSFEAAEPPATTATKSAKSKKKHKKAANKQTEEPTPTPTPVQDATPKPKTQTRKAGLSKPDLPLKVTGDSENPWMQQQQTDVEIMKKSRNAVKQKIATQVDSVAMIDVNKIHDQINADKNKSFKLFTEENKAQHALIRSTFAVNDQLEKDFAAEKKKIIADSLPPEEPGALPGWGSWIGEGAPVLKPKPKPKVQLGKPPKVRKDAKLKHVIISERRIKKLEKFQAVGTPFPYASKELYHEQTKMPLGPEFHTRQSFYKLIKPRLVHKAGAVIDPITYTKEFIAKTGQQEEIPAKVPRSAKASS